MITVDCRSCVLLPDSYEVGPDGVCVTCHGAKRETITECDGCGEREAIDGTPIPEPIGLAKYLVTFHDGGSMYCVYCNDCRDLAKMDWNGETKLIEAA